MLLRLIVTNYRSTSHLCGQSPSTGSLRPIRNPPLAGWKFPTARCEWDNSC